MHTWLSSQVLVNKHGLKFIFKLIFIANLNFYLCKSVNHIFWTSLTV